MPIPIAPATKVAFHVIRLISKHPQGAKLISKLSKSPSAAAKLADRVGKTTGEHIQNAARAVAHAAGHGGK